VAKSSVSREFIDASEEALKQLARRTFSGAQTRTVLRLSCRRARRERQGDRRRQDENPEAAASARHRLGVPSYHDPPPFLCLRA